MPVNFETREPTMILTGEVPNWWCVEIPSYGYMVIVVRRDGAVGTMLIPTLTR